MFRVLRFLNVAIFKRTGKIALISSSNLSMVIQKRSARLILGDAAELLHVNK